MLLVTLFDPVILDAVGEYFFKLLIVVSALIYFLGKVGKSFWLD